MKIAIIGFGYWGPNLARNFSSNPQTQVSAIVEPRADRRALAQRLYPQAQVFADPERVFKDPEINAVAIATPVLTHFPIALQALQAGKHVLVEKPLTSSLAESVKLSDLAREKKLVLMVDQTFIYTGAVERLKKMNESGELGAVRYFDSTRINLGLFQSDVNVLWDLAAHDLSILFYLFEERPISVHAVGRALLTHHKESIGYLTLNYRSGMIAHFHCSWVSPVKIRQILIGGDRKMVVYNDMEPTEKIKVYDAGYEVRSDEARNQILVDYRAGDIYIPKLAITEALANMAEDFRKAVDEGSKPRATIATGLEIVQVLEASQRSLQENGSEIALDSETH